MVSRHADTIDFDKLESNVNKAVDDEKLYWLRNDAKFRAVRQKVGSYDEFREIVNAAHLRPLDKGDKIDMDQRVHQPWNSQANLKKADASVTSNEMSIATANQFEAARVDNLPKDSHAFVKRWRTCRTLDDKISFMTSIGPESLLTIFKVEIPFGLLGEIVTALLHGCRGDADAVNPAGVEFAAEMLDSLSSTGRFELAVSFLSAKEKDELGSIINYMSSAPTDRVLALKAAYGLA